jgi:hypothetical protein
MISKVSALESENEALKSKTASLEEEKVLHAKAERALQVVKMAVDKGLVAATEFDKLVDEIMLTDDKGFETLSGMVLKSPSVKKASTIDEKIDMVKNASIKNQPVSLDRAIQIQNTDNSALSQLTDNLEKIWRVPPVVK